MLEQYKKDFAAQQEDKDLLPANDSLGKRKLLFIVAGGALALVFFLFLMGMFKTDEDALAVKDLKSEMVTKENFLALEDKLQMLSSRLEKLEQEKEVAKVATQPSHSADPVAASQPALQSTEEAIAMTSQAMRQFISKAAQEPAQEAIVIEDVAPKKETKVAKSKEKTKSKKVAHASTGVKSGTYVVQKGDTLSKISQRHFGTPNRWKAIYDANKDRIANINNLKVGTELVMPVQG